jgi:hypothetical protein
MELDYDHLRTPMEYRNGDPPERVPAVGELIDRFSGSIAVLAAAIDGATRSVSVTAVDTAPWSVDVSYLTGQGHLLTIRTVRSAKDLDPYALPVEDLASAITNAANREVSVNPGPRAVAPGEDPEAWAQRHVTDSRSLRAEVAGKRRTDVTISIDGVEVPGTRVDAGGWAAVEFQWGEQQVFCGGRPEVIGTLILRSARAGELP